MFLREKSGVSKHLPASVLAKCHCNCAGLHRDDRHKSFFIGDPSNFSTGRKGEDCFDLQKIENHSLDTVNYVFEDSSDLRN